MKKLTLGLAAVFVVACSNQKIDTKRAFDEMKKHEIQVVSDADILETAMETGKEISKNLQVAQSDSAEFNVSFQKEELDSLTESVYFFNKPTELKGKALELYDAYAYNSENGVESPDNVQFDEDKRFVIYTSAIQSEHKEVGVLMVRFSRKDIVLSLNQ